MSDFCSYVTLDQTKVSTIVLNIINPHKFMCSEHETIDGVKFVNWGKE